MRLIIKTRDSTTTGTRTIVLLKSRPRRTTLHHQTNNQARILTPSHITNTHIRHSRINFAIRRGSTIAQDSQQHNSIRLNPTLLTRTLLPNSLRNLTHVGVLSQLFQVTAQRAPFNLRSKVKRRRINTLRQLTNLSLLIGNSSQGPLALTNHTLILITLIRKIRLKGNQTATSHRNHHRRHSRHSKALKIRLRTR